MKKHKRYCLGYCSPMKEEMYCKGSHGCESFEHT